MNDFYIYAIVALLPLSACMVVFETNPYHALVIRGVLGAVAALVYVVFGAPDVALTEALVGTMLAITLYAVAVRSSLVMRLGVLQDLAIEEKENVDFQQLMDKLQRVFNKRYLRVEIVPYQNENDLQQALMKQEIHTTCVRLESSNLEDREAEEPPYQTTTRIKRLYEIMEAELSSTATSLTCVNIPDSGEKH
ncbi:hypothetical protein NIES2119_11890 [[Phormidium ambiguum] IAM M-71]|uniref:MrpA C-terminal/MbhD domain-containing protein n=1 Tax=[Phormidium ambiguum] IAM M-71 TaxID=454136 RepID=A0A1U7IL23_9CYAN|nr:DUF4040 domain-containing protein [Phormidium ambiguum]OKH37849.1 hypothetical protein NIES2119_11890 [Phormidium ambiguum IAM M-71]